MPNIRIAAVLLLLATYALPCSAARELVDDFDGASIDFSKWSGFDATDDAHEFLVRVDSGKLDMISVGDSSDRVSLGARTSVINPDLSDIQATITIVSANAGGNEATANIEGQYYNTISASPGDQTGDVAAMVSIGDRGGGYLEAWATIRVSTHSDFETWTENIYVIVTTANSINPNTAYDARIQYDNNTNIFTFSAAGSNRQVTGPPNMGSPNLTRQNLSATTCCSDSSSVHASFDDFLLANLPIDNFTGDHLDRTIWANHPRGAILASRVDPAATGKLLVYVSDETILQSGRSSTDLVLRERNPNRFEALISVSSDSALDAGLLGQARLNGYVYNQSRNGLVMPYIGCEGDVYAEVQIQLQNSVLAATAFAAPQDVGCNNGTPFISETFTQPLAPDTEYLLWIELNSNRLTLGLDNESYRHNIITPIFPPSPSAGGGLYRLSSLIQGTPISNSLGGDGVFEMLADNVYVGIDDANLLGPNGDSCFIATAAYGSYLDPQVRILRQFRDEHLLPNAIGKSLVGFYYRHSPPIADYISERDMLKAFVRSGLALVIYSIQYPTAAGLVLILMPLLVLRQRRKRNSA